MKNKENHIRENWFKDHIAELTQHGDLQVLKWKQPDSSFYSCKYVFDGNRMYISGDIGEAVFVLTWKADVHSFNDINIGYFEEKLQAYSEDRRNFSSGKAVKRLREWLNEIKENGTEYEHEKMKELFESARNCSSSEEWSYEYVNGVFNDFISELDADYWEWIYKIGDEIPWRIYGYLVGLKMASEQLKGVNEYVK